MKNKFNTPIDENFTNEKLGKYGSFKDILELIKNEKNNFLTKKINLNLGQDENKIKIALKIRNKGKRFKEVGGILRDSSDLNRYKSIIEKVSRENFPYLLVVILIFSIAQIGLSKIKILFLKVRT